MLAQIAISSRQIRYRRPVRCCSDTQQIAPSRIAIIVAIEPTKKELKATKRDVISGMFFSNLLMYFIFLSTASTLFKTGPTEINAAAEAAEQTPGPVITWFI